MSNLYSTHLSSRKTQEIQAVELLVALNTLASRQVLVTFLGERMTLDVVALIALHDKYGVALADTLAFAKALVDHGLENTSLDIVQAIKAQKSANEFDSGSQIKATDVVLYGFGRIGRILARLLMSRPASESGLQLKAIVVRPAGEGDLAKRASLLERDSVHGWFNGSVQVDTTNNGIIVNGRFIKVIYASDPSEVDYTAHDINDAIVIDNTGKWKDEAGLGKHLASKGVKSVTNSTCQRRN